MRAMSALMVSAVALLGLAQPASADVKIGILMPLSGKGASYGQHQETAMKMALEELEKTEHAKSEAPAKKEKPALRVKEKPAAKRPRARVA